MSRVALLCMATTLVLGFSKPENGTQTHQVAELIEQADTIPVGQRRAEPVQVDPAPLAAVKQRPPRRPSSYAADTVLNPVLGQVSSQLWSRTSRNSPDQVRDRLRRAVPGHFDGVGFPDIRTHAKHDRGPYAAADVNGWNQMISWRTLNDDDAQAEPIAHVRCMGLSPKAVARRADRYDQLILSIAMEYEVSASLIKAVITEESCFNHRATSPVGAQGLMQLMPETADWLKVSDSHDPEDNMRAGVRYLAMLQKQFDTLELALAAYNAGPGNVRRYKGVPPFAETRAYVQKVQAHYRRYAAATRLAAR